jgi:LmbE family N-acetylglucosaminyl deacetylase
MNVLAFFAHPDDETMLAGGALALLSKLGHCVHYLICTRGEGGETGIPPVCEQSLLGYYREIETRNAISELGGTSLTFLDYIDPIVGENNQLYSFTSDIITLTGQLAGYFFDNKIDILITHGSNGEYGHPAHITSYQAARQLFDDYKFDNRFLYTVQANYDDPIKPHLINKDDPADWILNVDSVITQKVNAARAHISQNALFVRRKTKELNRAVSLEEVIVNRESYSLAEGEKDPLYSIFQLSGCIEKKIDRN